MKLTDGVLLVTTIVGPEDHLPTGASSPGFVGDVEEVGVLLEQPFPCTSRLDPFSYRDHAIGAIASTWLIVEFANPLSNQPLFEVLVLLNHMLLVFRTLGSSRRLRFLGVTASEWLPIVIFKGFGDIHEVGLCVIAENEFHTLVVSAIELSC